MEQEIEPIYVFKAGANKAIGFSLSPWQNELRVDIREYVQGMETNELIRTKKGISMPVALFPGLANGVKEIATVMATDKTICRIEKSKREEIWVAVNRYKGHQLINIRTYAFSKESGDWGPTQKGVSMGMHLLPELEHGISLLEEEIKNSIQEE